MSQAAEAIQPSGGESNKQVYIPHMRAVPDAPLEADRPTYRPDTEQALVRAAIAPNYRSRVPDRLTGVCNIAGSSAFLTGGYVKVVYNTNGKPIPGTGPAQ